MGCAFELQHIFDVGSKTWARAIKKLNVLHTEALNTRELLEISAGILQLQGILNYTVKSSKLVLQLQLQGPPSGTLSRPTVTVEGNHNTARLICLCTFSSLTLAPDQSPANPLSCYSWRCINKFSLDTRRLYFSVSCPGSTTATAAPDHFTLSVTS
jgi:hypothetical protein